MTLEEFTDREAAILARRAASLSRLEGRSVDHNGFAEQTTNEKEEADDAD